MTDATNEPLTAADAGRILDRTPATVRMYADKGRLRHERTPSGVRIFRREDVEKFKITLRERLDAA